MRRFHIRAAGVLALAIGCGAPATSAKSEAPAAERPAVEKLTKEVYLEAIAELADELGEALTRELEAHPDVEAVFAEFGPDRPRTREMAAEVFRRRGFTPRQVAEFVQKDPLIAEYAARMLTERIQAGVIEGKLRRPPVPPIWTGSVDEALAAAAKDGSLVLLFVCADWSVACVKMMREVFTSPDVQTTLAKRFHAARLDVTRGTEMEEAMLARFGVNSVPTLLILAADGTERARREDIVDEKELLQMLREQTPSE